MAGPCFYCGYPMWNPRNDKLDEFLKNAGYAPRGPDQEMRHRTNVPVSVFLHSCLMTKEHLVRKADGGKGVPDNIVMACGWCNSVRGSATVASHMERVKARIRNGTHPVARIYQRGGW